MRSRPPNIVGSAPHAQRGVSRHELQTDLRAWYLRGCREHVVHDKNYLTGRRNERSWFKGLCNNQSFRHVLAAFTLERDALNRATSLVSWMKVAQEKVNRRSIPYEKYRRLSQLDKLDRDGGLRELILPELNKRLPHSMARRTTTISGLVDFLGLPTTTRQVGAVLRRHGRTAVVRPESKSAIEVTRLLQSWARKV